MAGDGESKKVRLDLTKTIVEIIDGRHCILSMMPDSIIKLSIGGPGITPELGNRVVANANINGKMLDMEFTFPLHESKELYTVEVLFGYDTAKLGAN